MRSYLHLLFILFASVPAFSITVNYPAPNARSASPIAIRASASTCKDQPTNTMGYSFDNNPNTTFEPQSFATYALIGSGSHVLHVKCWGSGGAADVVDVPVTITTTTESPLSTQTLMPTIQNYTNWIGEHDMGTPGSSQGTTWVVSSPSYSGHARAFWMKFTNGGGQRFHSSFADDLAATHFIMDTQVLLTNTSTLANVEMDLNQVLADGKVVIYGMQCNGYSGTWDITANKGTLTQYVTSWVHSAAKCLKPSSWTQNAWHHIQLAYSRDLTGAVTYENVVFDGIKYDINIKVNAEFALNWDRVLLTNFQLDGNGSGGSVNAYIDNLTVYHW